MFSRTTVLPKLSLFSRQISKNVALTNKFLMKDVKSLDLEQETAAHLDKTEKIEKRSKQFQNTSNSKQEQLKKDFNLNIKSTKKYFETFNNETIKIKSENHYKNSSQRHRNEKSHYNQLEKVNSNEIFDNLKKKLEKNLDSNKSLIQIIQELNDLYDIDSTIDEAFNRDPLKSTLTNKIFDKISEAKLDKEDFLKIANYMVRFEPKKFTRLNTLITTINSSLNADQLVNLVYVLRSPRLFGENIKNSLTDSTRLLKNSLNEIEKFSSIILAMRLFPEDPLVVKQLDYKLLQSKEKLNGKDWIDLFNTKSILRQRNMTLIESCAYSLINNKTMLDIGSVQKILLSCGILSYHDEQFYKYLVENLLAILEKNKSNQNWFSQNESNMLSIINSIGMLQVRDKKLLDSVCRLLADQKTASSKLIISYVISCGFLSYQPSDKKCFDSLFTKINPESLAATNVKDKLQLLNYVWSLCVLDKKNDDLIAKVLVNTFWSEFLKDNNKYMKSILLKIMLINLYAQLFHDSYNGPLLPSEINAANYTNILKPDHEILTDQLVSTLTSFRTIDKYFKTNMLTPFGIYIDALMVIDEKGIICPLANYFNENSQLETKNDKEKKIAIKIADFKDRTKINNKINGNLLLQLILLKELGYTPIIVNQAELSEPSVMKRIELIKKKLEKASRKTDELFIE